MYGVRGEASILDHTTRCQTAPKKEELMADPIRVGVIADLTGPLSFVGTANANVARMVIGDINARGGLLGRHLELFVQPGATDDAAPPTTAATLVEPDRVDVILGGIY